MPLVDIDQLRLAVAVSLLRFQSSDCSIRLLLLDFRSLLPHSKSKTGLDSWRNYALELEHRHQQSKDKCEVVQVAGPSLDAASRLHFKKHYSKNMHTALGSTEFNSPLAFSVDMTPLSSISSILQLLDAVDTQNSVLVNTTFHAMATRALQAIGNVLRKAFFKELVTEDHISQISLSLSRLLLTTLPTLIQQQSKAHLDHFIRILLNEIYIPMLNAINSLSRRFIYFTLHKPAAAVAANSNDHLLSLLSTTVKVIAGQAPEVYNTIRGHLIEEMLSLLQQVTSELAAMHSFQQTDTQLHALFAYKNSFWVLCVALNLFLPDQAPSSLPDLFTTLCLFYDQQKSLAYDICSLFLQGIISADDN